MTEEDWDKMGELLRDYIEHRNKEQAKKPCPSCGHCPTCGRSKLDPYRFAPRVPDPWTPYFLQERYAPADHTYTDGTGPLSKTVFSCE